MEDNASEPGDGQARGPGSEAAAPFPVIRVRACGFWKKEVVTLTPAELRIAYATGNIDEQLLTSPAQPPRRGEIVISHDDVRSVSRSRIGYLLDSSQWTRYLLETPKVRCEFRVRNRETANIDRRLRGVLGERFGPSLRRRCSFTEIGLLVTAVAVVCLGVFRNPWGLIEGIVVIGITGLVMMILSLTAAGLRQGRWVRRSKPWWWRLLSWRLVSRRYLRKPLRSAFLGWLFKFVGVVWFTVLFFSAPYINFSLLFWNGGLAFAILGFGNRLCRRTFSPYEHPDPRPPVLYLRAFEDDGRGTLQPFSILARMHGIVLLSRPPDADSENDVIPWRATLWVLHPVRILRRLLNAELGSTEEVLAKAFARHGPLVAVGRPDERLATPGADRMYLPDEDWQRIVRDYLSKSQAVVLQPSNSDGVRWEILHLFSMVPRHRVLISLYNFRAQLEEYEDFRDWFARHIGIRLPLSVPFLDRPSYVYFETDGTLRIQQLCYSSPLRWTFAGNAVDIDRTFFTFIQGMDGAPRDLPLEPKSHRFHAVASLIMPLIVVLMMVVILILAAGLIGLKPPW